jgi:hypothetical protein
VRACSQRSSLAIYISQRNPLGRVCNSHFPEKPTGKGFATEFPEKLTGKGFAIEFPVDSFGKCGKCTVPRDKHWEQGKNEIPSGSHWDGYASPLGKALTPPPLPHVPVRATGKQSKFLLGLKQFPRGKHWELFRKLCPSGALWEVEICMKMSNSPDPSITLI